MIDTSMGPCGGIGRRGRLKIYYLQGCGSSSLPEGTTFKFHSNIFLKTSPTFVILGVCFFIGALDVPTQKR